MLYVNNSNNHKTHPLSCSTPWTDTYQHPDLEQVITISELHFPHL